MLACPPHIGLSSKNTGSLFSTKNSIAPRLHPRDSTADINLGSSEYILSDRFSFSMMKRSRSSLVISILWKISFLLVTA